MGGGSSRDSASLAVRPVNALEVCEKQHTAHLRGKEGESTIVVRRGCGLVFDFRVPNDLLEEGQQAQSKAILFNRAVLAEAHVLSCTVNAVDLKRASLQVTLDIAHDFPVAEYQLDFEVTCSGESERVTSRHVLVVLYNAHEKQDHVYLDDDKVAELSLDALEGGVVMGCPARKVPRLWRFAQNESSVLEAALLMCKDAPRKVRRDPKALASHLAITAARSWLAFTGTTRRRGDQVDWRLVSVQSTGALLETGLLEFLRERFAKSKKDQGGEKLPAEFDDYFSDSDDDDDIDDETFASEMGLRRFDQLDQGWLLSMFYISVLRVLGVPARAITLFNTSHSPHAVATKGEKQPEMKSGMSRRSSAQFASKDYSEPLLRVFDVVVELWASGEWHVASFRVSHEGNLMAEVQSAHEFGTGTWTEMCDPRMRIACTDGPKEIVRYSSAWSCQGPDHVPVERTADIRGPRAAAAVLGQDATAAAAVGATDHEMRLGGSGVLGEPVPVTVIVGASAAGQSVAFNLTVCAISHFGQHRKLLRTFTGSNEAPFSIERRLDFDDIRGHVCPCHPVVEFICRLQVQGDSGDDDVMSPVGGISEATSVRTFAFYESLAFVPSHVAVQPCRAAASPPSFEPKLHLSDRLRLPLPVIKDLQAEDPNIRPVMAGSNKKKKVQSYELSKCEYATFARIVQLLESKLRTTNAELLEADNYPWLLAWHTSALPATRRATMVVEEIEAIPDPQAEDEDEFTDDSSEYY